MMPNKKVYFIRHGESVYNEWRKAGIFHILPFYPKHKSYADSRLSANGRLQASNLHKLIAQNKEIASQAKSVVVYCSPLRRAAETASIVFDSLGFPIISIPLLRERIDGIIDLGTPTSELRDEYKSVDFSNCSDYYWSSNKTQDPYVLKKEKTSSLVKRISEFNKIIQQDSHSLIFIVGHSNYHSVFTHKPILTSTIKNCEIREVDPRHWNK